jgi:RNA polymerase sigma factor (sigma-70 family)
VLTDEQRQRVAGSLGLARWVASNCGPLTEDNVAIAYLALCRAATTYKPGANMTWESYARQRVRFAIADARREWYGRGVDDDRVQTGAAVLHATATRTYEDPFDQLIDRIDGERAFAALPGSSRDKQIVLDRASGAPTSEVAARYGISEARVSQITFAVIGRAGNTQAFKPLPNRVRKDKERHRAAGAKARQRPT